MDKKRHAVRQEGEWGIVGTQKWKESQTIGALSDSGYVTWMVLIVEPQDILLPTGPLKLRHANEAETRRVFIL
jgi:hypothetical protein